MSGFAKGHPTEARLILAQQAAVLRAEGKTQREIGDVLSCSRQYVCDLLNDPRGERGRARKDSYRGTCETCGVATTGCYGPGHAPTKCAKCLAAENRAPHGTKTRYQHGCSCDDCRRANRESGRKLRGRPAPTHGVSGYRNYGCRCDVCRQAHSDYQWRMRSAA